MKNTVRFAVAAAMLASYGAAHAQVAPDPSTNASDLWLFVADTTNGTAYARDTGISINSIMPSSALASSTSTGSNAVLATNITASINLAADSNLTSFLATGSGHSLEYAVEAIQFPGSPLATGVKKPGAIKGLTTNPLSTTFVTNMFLTNLQNWGTGFETDFGYLLTGANGQGIPQQGTSAIFAFSNGSPTNPGVVGNVWGAGVNNNPGSTNLYGQGGDSANVPPGTAVNFYGLTGSGNTAQLQSYVLGQLDLCTTLTTTGCNTIGELASVTAPVTGVPLPAALWLMGSGLLGLAGVARRRATQA